MNAIRQKILEDKMESFDEDTKKIYRIAECICRTEFERAFNFNLDLPFGHPKNLICHANTEKLWNIVSFWTSLKDKYEEGKCGEPLKSAIIFFSDIQASGMLKVIYTVAKNIEDS